MSKAVRYLFAGFFALILAAVIIEKTSSEDPGWEGVLMVGLLFGTLGYGIYGFIEHRLDGQFGILLFTFALCAVVLMGALFQQAGSGFTQPGRAAKLTLILLLLLFFLGLSIYQRQYLRRAGPFLIAFGVLFFIYLYHTFELSPTTGTSGFVLFSGFLMGLNLFVFPRYVSRDSFLWVMGFISAAIVLIGLPVYSNPGHTFMGLTVRVHDSTFTPLFTGGELHPLQSIFGNPNMLGVVTFVGIIAGGALVHRYLSPKNDTSTEEEDNRNHRGSGDEGDLQRTALSVGFASVALLMCIINAIGLYLSHSRAAFLATGVAGALYGAYLISGREIIPYATAGLIGLVGLFIVMMPVLGIDPSGRFTLWSGAIGYLSDNLSLLGSGVTAPHPDDLIEPYVGDLAGNAVHNSYLTVMIKTGIVGVGAYIAIIGGSILSGVIRYKKVNVAALAIALGFAVHLWFETYPLFHNQTSSVYAALMFGYLIVNGVMEEGAKSVDDDRPTRQRDPMRRKRRPSSSSKSSSNSNSNWK